MSAGSDSAACQRVLVGDALNDEQWSNDLPNPPPHNSARDCGSRRPQTCVTARMGKKMCTAPFPAIDGPITNNELTA